MEPKGFISAEAVLQQRKNKSEQAYSIFNNYGSPVFPFHVNFVLRSNPRTIPAPVQGSGIPMFLFQQKQEHRTYIENRKAHDIIWAPAASNFAKHATRRQFYWLHQAQSLCAWHTGEK